MCEGQTRIRRELLQSAAHQLGQWFDHTATIQLRVLSDENINSDTIASAKTEFADATGDGFGQTEVVRRKVIDGVDLNGASLDSEVIVNWTGNWYTGPDPTGAAPNQEDFFRTMFHELLHTFGFGTDITLAGEDGWPRVINYWRIVAFRSAKVAVLSRSESRHLLNACCLAAEALSHYRPLAKSPNFFDVSGDGNVTALDTLQVINALARQSPRKINAIPAKIQWEGRDFEDELWS